MHIWNMDETGLQFSHVPGKIVARKGSRYVQARISGNRETITIMACGNAAGQMLAPNVIFKGKTAASLQSVDSNRAPPGTTVSVSESGWTKQGIATLWFKKSFLPAIGRVRPQVLISDGHNSHNFLELVELARENNIKLVELPEHTSHWLQPLDRSCFKTLKSSWNRLCQNFSNQNPGRIINKSCFFEIFTPTWQSISPEHLINGFRSCGIYPFDPSIIPPEAFLPSTTTIATVIADIADPTPCSDVPLSESNKFSSADEQSTNILLFFMICFPHITFTSKWSIHICL
ncbi:uncharacterized protein LOC141900547 [Tubulanus polymorphus]|uniref:uncharacterized protein LOC141900517 n=1 Tax=Tubulanus polymorphus TaxID=672921 RepID=UPI003DA4B999